jgi:hypothetical protein
VRLSSHLQDVSKLNPKEMPIKHDFNLRDISEGAILSMFEFPLHIENLKSKLSDYNAAGIPVNEGHLSNSGEQWLELAGKKKGYVLVLSYLLSLSDAVYRKNVDSVKIMSAVAKGDLDDNVELENAWSKLAYLAHSGEDFDEWRKERSFTILEAFVDGDVKKGKFTLKSGSFDSLLSDVPLYRFDAVNGIKSGNTSALYGAYSNNANGIADLMGIPVNESGILSGQSSRISNVPKDIINAYHFNQLGMNPR